jgi:POT family proton-dependent oligopeptide transporter
MHDRLPGPAPASLTGAAPPLAGATPAAHPRRAFLVLFFVEVWERFGYYGMASIALLYMVQRLNLADARADLIWGTFSALAYALPIAGGYLGDRVLGARRSLVLGAATLGLGYLLLALPLNATFFPALGVIAVGNGIFKVNPNNLVSRLVPHDRSRLDILFTIYYMSLNLGAFVSILLTPWIKDHPQWIVVIGPLRFDSWHLAFGLSALGLALGLANFSLWRRELRPYGAAPDFKPLPARRIAAVLALALAGVFAVAAVIRYRVAGFAMMAVFLAIMIVVFARLRRSAGQAWRGRIRACIVFTAVSVLWAVLNQQIYTSLTLFALRSVRHRLLGLHVAAAQFQDLNQFWLVLLALPLAWLYRRLAAHPRGDFPLAAKYAAGLYCLALGFLVYALAAAFTSPGAVASPWWLVAGYGLQSLGELLISALGFSMISQLVPERARGLLMGVWFLGMGLGMYAGGVVASWAAVPAGAAPAVALALYTHVFAGLAAAALVCALAVTAAVPCLSRWSATPTAEG